jgi:hypothetical protein
MLLEDRSLRSGKTTTFDLHYKSHGDERNNLREIPVRGCLRSTGEEYPLKLLEQIWKLCFVFSPMRAEPL